MALPIRKKAQIVTERLILKPLSMQDAEGLKELLTNPEITETFMVPEMESESQMEELVRNLIAFSQPEDTAHLEYGIYLQGKIIGFVNDCEIGDHEIEIGYLIHPRHKCHGYATEAVSAVLAELREMGFQKVTAGCFSENTASFRVMEKCGMHLIDKTDEIEYRGKQYKCKYCVLLLYKKENYQYDKRQN